MVPPAASAMTVVFVCSRASALSVRMSSFVQSRRFIIFFAIFPPPKNPGVALRKAPLDGVQSDRGGNEWLLCNAGTRRTACIKDKKIGLAALRDIRTALGAETFNLIADGMADSQIKSVAANLDKHHPELKTANAAWQRRHVLALADGSVEPMEKPKSPPKKEKAKKSPAAPKAPERISFVSAGATRKR
jgi:hypothetical protein